MGIEEVAAAPVGSDGLAQFFLKLVTKKFASHVTVPSVSPVHCGLKVNFTFKSSVPVAIGMKRNRLYHH
jgi:hypothetical protein